MTLKDIKTINPGFLFFKKGKQWKDCDIYEAWNEFEYKELKEAESTGQVLGDIYGGGPVYVLVDKGGEARIADFYEGGDINAFLYPNPPPES